ncbi:hypothetical protein [Cypionkella sp.]|uniref:hypothetical protein n=1 Tax=Cypionkella sp. TaxID=2811411 RepID=UPI002725F12D|nr:hypothetical protein [Cypionkella sp.]MDO8984537.1 hypothetical protein [Cypionkella sp.]MDP1576642.1 hypothetical protein [Cypionkella sp.]MDP2049290.1 hypothetical protein [Cypionkella sp.]
MDTNDSSPNGDTKKSIAIKSTHYHAHQHGNGATNIAILRRCALDLARRDTSKVSLSIKLKRAGWSDAFLLSLPNQLERTYAKRDCPVRWGGRQSNHPQWLDCKSCRA